MEKEQEAGTVSYTHLDVYKRQFYSRKCAKEQEKSGVLWGGWFQERDWKHWQAHMEKLIGRMDELLTREGETVALWTGSICQKAEPGKIAGKKEGEERENPHRSEEESMTFFERELKKNVWNGSELFRTKVCRELLLWKADGSDPCQNQLSDRHGCGSL